MRSFAIWLMLAALTAQDPTLTLAHTAFDYDLTMTRPYLPLAWHGAVLGGIDAPAHLQIEAEFAAAQAPAVAADATDRLSVRNGVGVAVVSDSALTIDGGGWTWNGPQGGAGAKLVLASTDAVTAQQARLALQQIFYANLGGSRAIGDRRVLLRIKRLDNGIGQSADAVIVLHPVSTPIPLQVRFLPISIFQGQRDMPIQVVDAAGTASASTTFLPPSNLVGMTIDPSGTVVVTGQPFGYSARISTLASVSAGSYVGDYRITSAAGETLAHLPVEVLQDPSLFRFVGDLPLEIDLRPDTDLAIPFAATASTPNASFGPHPGYPDDGSASILDGAVDAVDGDAGQVIVRIRRSVVKAGHPVVRPAFLKVELRLTKDARTFRLPAVIHLVWPDPG